MIRIAKMVGCGVIGLCLMTGCDSTPHDSRADTHPQTMATARSAMATVRPAAAATTQPSMGQVHGIVEFTQDANGEVTMTVDVSGLPPNSIHGFHIHEKGDLSAPDLSSAGGHFNPGHDMHGAPDAAHHHAGDLGNLAADSDGNVHERLIVHGISIGGPDNDIVGRSVIIHKLPDDLKSQPAGASGARIGGGVINMKK